MALTDSYLITTKNLKSIIESLVGAKSPERFTNKFLEDLGFKSTNDRLYIGVFKALGLLDENGTPTPRYHKFLDQSETGKVLALGIQEAYNDLFTLRKDAQILPLKDIKGKLKTLTQGQKSDTVINFMGNTFKALCDVADWTNPTYLPNQELSDTKSTDKPEEEWHSEVGKLHPDEKMNLHYNIQIHLPETTNMATYDVIFQSLKKHLL
jgi:hypothetical protein